jgi:CubicO group peptidase (beta-lactamase class C family)
VLVKPDSGEPDSIPAKKEITIRDLLRPTSGITYNGNGDLGGMYESAGVSSGLLQYEGTIGDSVKKLAGHPLLFNPGDRWEYSLGVDLGRLVDALPHPMGGLTLDREINGLAYQAIND